MERFQKISINDSNLWATQAVPHARQLWNMLNLARVITLGALNRNESRGAHYKPDFPERNDEEFLKTTIAEYSDEAPVFSYEAVDIGLIEPRKRDYSSKGKAKAATAEKAKESGLPVPDGGNSQQFGRRRFTDQKRRKILRRRKILEIEDGDKIKDGVIILKEVAEENIEKEEKEMVDSNLLTNTNFIRIVRV